MKGAERQQGIDLMQDAKRRTEKEIAKIEVKLDRLTAAYLDAGAFSAAEFRKRKVESLNAKRKLQDNLTALDREDVLRFEPIKRFVNGSKQLKYVAEDADPKEMRAKLESVGSNLTIRDRRLHWEPRGAWQLVVAQGSFAHVNAASEISDAAFCGETRLTATKWSDGESNPDLLNAIQASFR